MSDHFEAVINLATGYGFAVLPVHGINDEGGCTCPKGRACSSAGKHPRIPAWQVHATSDPTTIAQWWATWPTANVGIATGAKSNVVVLDVDPRSGGFDSLQELDAQIGGIPDTLKALTGGGGMHFYFRSTDYRLLKNSASKIGSGLDFKADGGFVVAPPSLHASGHHYKWM